MLYRTVVFLLQWCCEVLDIGVGWQGVCRLHGICIDSLPNLYLVTEPVLGGTLEACLQQFQSKGVPLDRAFALARSIARQVWPSTRPPCYFATSRRSRVIICNAEDAAINTRRETSGRVSCSASRILRALTGTAFCLRALESAP